MSQVGHRARLWERCLTAGFRTGFVHSYEKLEFLLTFAIPRQDTKPLAKRLLAEFGSLPAVMEAPIEKLCAVEGVGIKTAHFLSLFREMNLVMLETELQGRDLLGHPDRVKDFLRRELGWEDAEYFAAVFLDSRNCLIRYSRLFRGTHDRGMVYPRELVKEALACNAACVIVAHNHPSGTTEPSIEDLKLTATLYKSLNLVDIRLLDHLIITRDRVSSLHELGYIGPNGVKTRRFSSTRRS